MFYTVNRIYNWFFNYKTLDELRSKFFLIFGACGSIFLPLYAVVNLAIGNYTVAVFDVVIALVILLVSVITIKLKSTKIASTFGLIPMAMLSMHNFANGGLYGQGIYWTYLLGPMSMFISKLKLAVIANVIYLGFTLLIFLASQGIDSPVHYSTFQYLTYLLSYVAITVISALFHIVWSLSHKLAVGEQSDVLDANKQLESKVRELEEMRSKLEKSYKDVEHSMQETEKVNKTMVNRELMMIDLKKENAELKKQLESPAAS